MMVHTLRFILLALCFLPIAQIGSVFAQDAAAPAATEAAPAPAPAAPAPAAPVATHPAPPPANLEDVLKPVASIITAIDAAEASVERVQQRDSELAQKRSEIEGIRTSAQRAADALRPKLDDINSQIEKLGKPPAADAPPEAPEIAAERARLNALSAQLDGAIKTMELAEVRSRQLVARVQELRQGLFTRFLFRRADSPLRAKVWQTVAAELPGAGRQITNIAAGWWSAAKLRLPLLLAVLGTSIAVYLGLKILMRQLIRARLDRPSEAAPTFFERAANAGWVAPAFALPATAAALVLFAGLDSLDLLTWQVERFAGSALFSTLVFVGVSSLARAILQPKRSRWRLVDVSDRTAWTLCRTVQGIAAVYAMDFLARRVVRILVLPLPVSVAAAFIASLAFAALLFILVRTPFVPQGLAPGTPVSRWRPYWLKAPLAAVGITIVVACLLGYVALGRFISGQVVMTGSAVVIIVLLHLAIGAIATERTGGQMAVGRVLEGSLGLDEAQRRQLGRGLALLLNVLLAVLAVPLILLAWGSSLPEILGWLKAAIFGFEIGQIRISLARILIALALFLVLLALTRLVQRWLSASVLHPARMDQGIANSIYTGVGYAGFAIAILVALAYGGLDITSLAIVAGALSVGIGFGLQSIVNNFVSGLILLVERPIKVGDWIVVKEHEGYVRRIAVRATEIETFDRASVIVPNSELITNAVQNWTHRNALGRVVIPVRVTYKADPDRVQEVLQKVAEQTSGVLKYPAPVVALDKLGEQAMEFSLRAYVADINRSLATRTELRREIVKALRAAGIDIPFPALDGHAAKGEDGTTAVTVRVGVSHNADPEHVQKALKAAAGKCSGVFANALPQVTFDDVGDSALQFSVHVTAAEPGRERAVASSLRTEIVKALREHGIEIANPQQDVHLRDLDAVRAFLTRIVDEAKDPPPEDRAEPSKLRAAKDRSQRGASS